MKALACAATLLLAGFCASAQSPQSDGPPKRPMTFEDLQKMRRLGDIDVSRDGRWILFTATDVDLAKNTKTPHLWIVPVNGAAQIQPTEHVGDDQVRMATVGERPLTASSAGESRGRFSPDGKQIAFLTDRGQGTQIWLADFDGAAGTMGEPRQLTHISTEADNVTWDPDGQHLLFTSAVYPECSAGGQSGIDEDRCDKKRDDDEAQSKVKARIFTSLLYRHWNHFTGDKRSHLFLASAEDGTFRDLNPGDTHDVPPFSLGEPDGWDFSPDGKELAFEEKKVDDPALSTNVDIFTLNLDAPSTHPVKISTSPGGDYTPRYSPDGKWIAWRMQRRAGYESDRFRLVLYDRSEKAGSDETVSGETVSDETVGGKAGSKKTVSESRIRELLPNFDRWVDEEAWSPDSAAIYFTGGDHGEEAVYAFTIVRGLPLNPFPAQLTRDGEYGDLHPTADSKKLIVSRMTVLSPSEVVALDSDMVGHTLFGGGYSGNYRPLAASQKLKESQLTHLNTNLLAQLDLPAMDSFWVPSIGNVKVQGFLIRPPNFDPHKKYPVKFLIHGGPQGAWGDSWSYRWNPELFAANGYVVVMINPGGSTGYGQAFVDRVNGDWGGRPFIDLMRGLDYAEAHYPFIDKTRECALGASYGGYMANWILGHSTRFKCIVSHDGMFNTESAWGTTEELWFNEWEFKGTPWSNRALYRQWSPMLAETHFKTPTLVVHSQLDYRLDVSEGYQLFDTLQRMKVPSKMLYFPDEGHWILQPQNSQLWYKTVNDWVDQWTKK
jgi:dipeptidyl aminopeptidase/acylaminoacyl peptidase